MVNGAEEGLVAALMRKGVVLAVACLVLPVVTCSVRTTRGIVKRQGRGWRRL